MTMPSQKRMNAISKAVEIISNNSPEIVKFFKKAGVIPKEEK